jgi:DNA repair exonuclease SbcCD nuclease subunit
MIYITGDTHGNQGYNGARDLVDKLNKKNFPESKKLTKDDYVIIAGDFGFIFNNKETKEERYWLDWLDKANWTTLFIDGNHENFERLYEYPEINMFEDVVGKINDSVFHLKRGRIYNIDGNKFFTFGGATSVDKTSRIEGLSWWPQEEPTTAEFMLGLENLSKHDNKVDYVLTHTAPTSIVKEMDDSGQLFKYNETALSKYLEVISSRVEYKKWFFGHFHSDEEFRDGEFIQLYYKIYNLIEGEYYK